MAALRAAAAKRGVPLTVVEDGSAEVRTAYFSSLLLVRPVHHVAWAGEEADAAKVIGMAAGYGRAAG